MPDSSLLDSWATVLLGTPGQPCRETQLSGLGSQQSGQDQAPDTRQMSHKCLRERGRRLLTPAPSGGRGEVGGADI